MLKIYSLLDRKLVEYGQLLLARNDDAIKRAVLDGVRGSGSQVEKYSEDFDVFQVGEFDAETGAVVGSRVRLVGNVRDILEVRDGERQTAQR